MPPAILLHGQPHPSLASQFAAHFSIAPQPPAQLLLNLSGPAAAFISAAEAFAAAHPPGTDALIISLLPPPAVQDWPAARNNAELWAFTRHAALAWAPRRIRLNAIALGTSPTTPDQPPESAALPAAPCPALPATHADILATILAMWRFSSMTGQMIRLGA